MRHKVSDVVNHKFNKHWKSKKLWNANPPNSAKRWNLDIKTSSPDTKSLRVQMPECVNYSRKWLCLGNKYFLTSTGTSTSRPTRKLYLSTDQIPVPVLSRPTIAVYRIVDTFLTRPGLVRIRHQERLEWIAPPSVQSILDALVIHKNVRQKYSLRCTNDKGFACF